MLQTIGAISMSDVAVELGLAATANLSLDDSRVRKLAKRETAGSAIGLADLYGKANFEYTVGTKSMYINTSYLGGPLERREYVWSKGIQVNILTPTPAKFVRVNGYDQANNQIFSQGMSISAGGYIVSNSYHGDDSDGNGKMDSTSINNPGNQIFVGHYITSGNNAVQYPVYKLCVVDDAGKEYELANHRNFTIVGRIVSSSNGNPPASTAYFDSTTGRFTEIAPNYP